MDRRPKNREEVHDQRQKEALAELEGLSKAGGLLGSDAEQSIAKTRARLSDGFEPDYARLQNPNRRTAFLIRLPLILLCAIILTGLAVKYLL